MSFYSYSDTGLPTIELTPELVFERLSDVGSPPGSMLSYNSGNRSSTGSQPRRHTDTFPRAKTVPRKRTFSPMSSEASSLVSSPRSMTNPPNQDSLRRGRGYHSLGSGTKALRPNKEHDNKGGYGVAISIKGIKGHPFVILEDNDKHRHMVPAPTGDADSLSSSDAPTHNDAPTHTDAPMHTNHPTNAGSTPHVNGHASEPEDLTPKAPPRRYGTLHKDFKPKQPKLSNQPKQFEPDVTRNMAALAREQLVKPSEIRAAQKSPSNLHTRSPRSRNAHERSRTLPPDKSAANRSRSLSPNRALANNKMTRSRSVSPPRKTRGRRIDDNNMQPVSSLIGFFETTDQDAKQHPAPPAKVPLMEKNKTQPTKSKTRPRSTNVPGLSRPRIDSREIDVTPDVMRTNLTVTTATVPAKHGATPMGRYFALTSPAGTSPKSILFPHPPQTVPIKSEEASSAVSSSTSSSDGGTTDEGTLNIEHDAHADAHKPSHEFDLTHTAPKPWHSSKEPRHQATDPHSGVSIESVTRPSKADQIFGSSIQQKGYRHVSPSFASLKRSLLEPTPPDFVQQNIEGHINDNRVHEEHVVPVKAKRIEYLFSTLREKSGFQPSPFYELVKTVSDQDKTKQSQQRRSALRNLTKHCSIDDSHDPVTPVTKETSQQGETPETPKVSKAKIIGPSRQLLRKTRRKRNAQRLSTGKPYSGSEWSESEYSDAESLGASIHVSEDEGFEKADNETDSTKDCTSPLSATSSEPRHPKRPSSIVFGKISSQDVTKLRSPHDDGSSTAPTVAELQEHITELRDTVNQLQQKADEDLDNIVPMGELRDKLKRMEQENGRLEDEIVEGRKMLKELERKLEEAKKDVGELRKNAHHDRLIKRQQTKELDDMKSQLSEMSDELERNLNKGESPGQHDHIMKELERLRKDYDDLLLEQMDREKKLKKRGEEISELRKESEISEPRVIELQHEVQRLKDAQHRSSSSSSSSEEEDFPSRVREVEERNKRMLRKSQQEMMDAQFRAEQLETKVSLLQRKLDRINGERGNDAEVIEKLTEELDNTKADKKKLETSLATLEKQRSTLKGQMLSARDEREDGDRQIRTLDSEGSRLKGRITELENEVERLKKELSRSRRHLEAQVADLEQQVSTSDRKLSELNSNKAKLEKELSEAKLSSDPLLADLRALECQKNDLEEKLSEITGNMREKDDEIFGLRDELRRMSSTSADVAGATIQELEDFKKRTGEELALLREDVEAKGRALRESDRNNNKLQEELRRMDLELEEELHEREATVAEYKQVERTLHDLEAKIAEANLDKEEQSREMENLKRSLSTSEKDKSKMEDEVGRLGDHNREVKRELHRVKEEINDKNMEIENLTGQIRNVESSNGVDQSKLTELEHYKYVTSVELRGLKQALEAKHGELEEAEEKYRRLEGKMKDSEEENEKMEKKVREVEKQRRLTSKEVEDLTSALSDKVAALDVAQRKLRRAENQMISMEEASSLATSIRQELDRAKRNHMMELERTKDEISELKAELVSSQRNVEDLEDELKTYESRYEAAASESMELERLRRQATQAAGDAQHEAAEKSRSLNKAEDKMNKLEEQLSEAESRLDDLAQNLRESERHRKDAENRFHEVAVVLEGKEKELKEASKKMGRLHDELERSNDVSGETKETLKNLKKLREEVQEEVSASREEINVLEEQLHDAEDKIDQLEHQLSDSESDLSAARKKVDQAEKEKKEAQRQLEDVFAEMDDRTRALDQAQEAIGNIDHKMREYERSHEKTTSKLHRMKSDKDMAQRTVDELQQQVKDTGKEIQEAENLIEIARREADNAERKCEELEDNVKRKEEELRAIQEEMEEVKSENEEKERVKKKAEEKYAQAQKQVEALESELKDRGDYWMRKKEELEREVQELEAELKVSEDDLEKTEIEKIELERKLNEMEEREVGEKKKADSVMKKEMQKLRDSLDEKTQQVFAAEDTIYRQKEVIEEMTSLQRKAEQSSMEQMESFMCESDKQFENLKSHLQERNEQVKVALKEKQELKEQVEALTSELETASSDADRARSSHEVEQRKMREVEKLMEELRGRLKEQQVENDQLRKEISRGDSLRSQASDSEEECSRLQLAVEELTDKFHQVEQEREDSVNKLQILQDKIGQMENEIEMKRSQVEGLQSDTNNQKQEIVRLRTELERGRVDLPDGGDTMSSLREKIGTLEEKLQQEASELNAIDNHHRKTEQKLREVLRQAETETNKANHEKELLSVRAKSLKQQLMEVEQLLTDSEDQRRRLQEELSEKNGANYELEQALAAMRLAQAGSKSASANGSLFTSV
ncbi:uncharacterized protein LOC104265795 isoform X3 [Ciona intestinalis]